LAPLGKVLLCFTSILLLRISKFEPQKGCQNGRSGPHFGQNLQNAFFPEFFDSRVLKAWKNPFSGYMGRGGVANGLVPKKAKIGSEVDFGDFAQIGPPAPGSKTT